MHKTVFHHLLLAIPLAIASLTISHASDTNLDLVIQGGRVVDGTGAPWFVADIGIDNGVIVRIGKIQAEDASTVIDATGLVVAPGFIDMMGQTASPMINDPKTAINLLTQGITTINA